MTTSFTMSDDMADRIKMQLSGTETISQFAYKATEERLNRLEARDERAKIQMLAKNKELLKPIVLEIMKDENNSNR